MNVMIASPDRDFLTSYQKLFELNTDMVTAVFDGFQVLARLQDKNYDFVLLDRELPRVEHDKLVQLTNDLSVPTVVLQKKRITARNLLNKSLAESYLVYPFLPEELFERIREVFQKKTDGRVLQVGDTKMNVSQFRLEESMRVTNEEMNVLIHLLNADKCAEGVKNEKTLILPVRHGMYYVNSLNQKFEALQKKVRIHYIQNEGYELVE